VAAGNFWSRWINSVAVVALVDRATWSLTGPDVAEALDDWGRNHLERDLVIQIRGKSELGDIGAQRSRRAVVEKA